MLHNSYLRAGERLIAFAGAPNVGKSTLFNALTGLHQHTGNWSGKTVGCAFGHRQFRDSHFLLADTPGAYSLAASSAEEELARDFICFSNCEKIAVVCDATCLSRGLVLALQIMEAHSDVCLCLNLMDEAEKIGINPDISALSKALGIDCVATCASTGEGIEKLLLSLHRDSFLAPKPLIYAPDIEDGIAKIILTLGESLPAHCSRFIAISLLCGDKSAELSVAENLGISADKLAEVSTISAKYTGISDRIATALALRAKEIELAVCGAVPERSVGIDRLITHPIFALPCMALLLTGVLWLTIEGANVPSALISEFLFWLGDYIGDFCGFLPPWLFSALFDGIWRTTAWVTAVMLPPMAIFFPIFTLLEDVGYLPRVAFNLDGFFQRAQACGKQGLTMCMGFGCNAAGVVGCRIIDSPRERMIAILTNSFVPCNGRFPALIAIITIFFATNSLVGAGLLAGIIVLGVAMTLLFSRLLSTTIFRGVASSFTLELPPYRRPNILQVLVRSLIDRTIFVLGRALIIAAPAGLFIWILAQFNILAPLANFLDPLGQFLGLDGIIILAFILGLPANEIVVPIILMCILSETTLTDYASLAELGEILISANWTAKTALCFLIFTLLHSPCSTTLLTIKKETGAVKWAILAAILPTIAGCVICAAVNAVCVILQT